MRTIAAATIALFALGSVPATAQDDLPSAEEILDRVYANYGSPEDLAKVKNRVFEGTAQFEGFGDEGTATEMLETIGRVRIKSSLPGFGDFEEGASYGVVWEMHPMAGGARILTGVEAMTRLRYYALLQHRPWKELYGKVELVDVKTLEDRECYQLRLHPRALVLEAGLDGGTRIVAAKAEQTQGMELPKADVLFVDRETLLPHRLNVQMTNPMGAPVELQLTLSDWKAVDGILYPHQRISKVQGFTWIQKSKSIRHDVDLEENTFNLPAKVREALNSTLDVEQPETTEIKVERIEEQHAAVIRVKCTQEEVAAQMSICLPEVMIYLTSIGAKVNGSPFSRYYSYDPVDFDFETGIPVAEPIEGKGRIQPTTLPGGYAVSGWHLGPYEKLGETHTKMQEWIAANGIETTGPCWEYYWTDPGMEPDPKKWRTQILWPCKRPEGEEEE